MATGRVNALAGSATSSSRSNWPKKWIPASFQPWRKPPVWPGRQKAHALRVLRDHGRRGGGHQHGGGGGRHPHGGRRAVREDRGARGGASSRAAVARVGARRDAGLGEGRAATVRAQGVPGRAGGGCDEDPGGEKHRGPAGHRLWQVVDLPAAGLSVRREAELHHHRHLASRVPDGGSGHGAAALPAGRLPPLQLAQEGEREGGGASQDG